MRFGDEPFLVFVREILERAAFGLGKQERREDTCQHEEGEDLKTGESRRKDELELEGNDVDGERDTYICLTKAFVPPIFFNCANPTCATIAPSLPDAAEIPCPVLLYLVGNTSPGTMNVVVFGPKFWKKFVRQYKNTNAFVPPGEAVSLSYAKPMITKRMVSIVKPMSWIGLRPHLSMRKKVA
jgi:hypothetical protein